MADRAGRKSRAFLKAAPGGDHQRKRLEQPAIARGGTLGRLEGHLRPLAVDGARASGWQQWIGQSQRCGCLPGALGCAGALHPPHRQAERKNRTGDCPGSRVSGGGKIKGNNIKNTRLFSDISNKDSAKKRYRMC